MEHRGAEENEITDNFATKGVRIPFVGRQIQILGETPAHETS